MSLDLTLRPGEARDRAYVHSTWMHSYQHSRVAHDLGERYTRVWRKVIDDLLERSTLVIAYQNDAPDIIIGWLCFEPESALLHYVYVRGALHRFGVASVLLGDFELSDWTATHGTVDSLRIIRKRQELRLPYPHAGFIDGRAS